ncbi:MAG TPA: protein phosphatase 2C domain-containing protein [Chitinophagaceae bacterium]|nr:protein phosphatase 2C domain-containing protein [Chitinophagaceae bacterium]
MAENYFGITDTGRQRTNNEDTFIAEKVLNGRYIMACVIDGVGGYAGGEVAAAMARQTILQYFTVPSGDVSTMLKEAVIEANKKIYNERLQNRDNEQMACVLTIAVADVENKQFYYAHIGDTRLYLFRDASLIKVTKDHSFVGFLEDSGRLSEEGAMQHPKRNEINKALGFDAQIGINSDYMETGVSPFLPGDLLLLCSDGLTDMINRAEITAILTSGKTLEEKGKNLINAANERGGKDNITIVLVQNDGVPIKLKATKPKAVKKKEQKKHDVVIEGRAKTVEVPKPAVTTKKNNSIVIILSIVSFLLLGSLLWMIFRTSGKDTLPTSIATVMNSDEKGMQDTLNNLSGDTLLLQDSLYNQPFSLNDSLVIKKDSLHIKGAKSFVFLRDSLFAGPAIYVASSNKYLLLENLVFQNFDVGILTHHKNVFFKNVQFKNCRIGVQYSWQLPDSVSLNGAFGDTTFTKTDSISNY